MIILKSHPVLSEEMRTRQYKKYKEQFDAGLMILEPDIEVIEINNEIKAEELIFEADEDWRDKRLKYLEEENERLRMDKREHEKESELLKKRIRHLLESEFISSFDEKHYITKEYVRDIKDADRIANYPLVAIPAPEKKIFKWW